MDELKNLLARLSIRQRITIGIAAIAVLAGLVSLSKWNKERDFRPLFSNVAPDEAGQIVAKIRESGSEFRLSDGGGTVLVPSGKVAELRLQLAASGLPKSGRIGFELFDKTNFGATDFTEQVNYHRALEGELERSVMSLAEVEQARVHITFAKESIYSESKQAAKASVMVKVRPGAKVSAQNVLAICHLTASAVEGLLPEAVSVLDMSGNLLNRPKRAAPDGADGSEAGMEYRQKLERDALAKINATLEPLLGTEKYRAAVSIDCDLTSGEQSEEVYDPTKSVMVTSQRTEDGSSAATAAGVPGTASNLPRPTSRPATGAAGMNRRTENIAYQSSRLVKHLKLPQGTIKRVSVSVLLDHDVRVEKGKRLVEAPSAEKLKVVRDLVAGVTGVVPDRGDQVIVESFPFEATLRFDPPVISPAAPATTPSWGPPWLQDLLKQKNFAIMAGAGTGVVVLLLAGMAILLRRSRKKTNVTVAAALAAGKDRPALAQPAPDMQKELESKIAEQAVIKEAQAREVLAALKLPPVTTKKTEVLVKHIGSETKKDPAVMAQVVRSWLNADNN
jgi:flagellar M-ring protein FliF